MSTKNKLQESFQKLGLPPPTYRSGRIGGTDHEPVWLAQVELPTGEQIEGDPSRSKKEAERSAALMAIIMLREQRETISPPKKSCLLIDGESLPDLVMTVPIRKDLDIIVFSSSRLSGPYYGPMIQKVIVPTNHSNGVDSCIQLYVGAFLMAEKYDRYLIGTRDPYGSALVELIQSSIMPWKAKTANLVFNGKDVA